MDVLWPVVVWWAALAVVGWAAVPLVVRLFPALPDRGLAFARPFGLLLAGYTYWLAALAGVVPNSRVGAAFILALLVAAGIALGWRDRASLVPALRSRRRLLLGYEWLSFVAFAGWAWYRAHNPAIETAGGEKYMEMAFLNAVLRSPTFPPLDPWLSGFHISYYYFGYVIAALLVLVTGLLPQVAFNLVTPMNLSLTLVATFGIGYNLAVLGGVAQRAWRVGAGALTASLLALVGNLEGALEVAFLRGWGRNGFWDWLDIRSLTVSGGTCGEAGEGFASGAWLPTRHIWWWRASRVIQDDCGEVIHEFPFFSFMLADNHPHLLALPYALMTVGLALSVLAGGLERLPGRRYWSPSWLALPLIVGALGFLNAWDLPTYGVLVVLAYAVLVFGRPAVAASLDREDKVLLGVGGLGIAAFAWRFAPRILVVWSGTPAEQQAIVPRVALVLFAVSAAAATGYGLWTWAVGGSSLGRRLVEIARFGAWLAILSILLYLPFHLGFASQASGIGTVGVHSRPAQWFVHFGLLVWLAGSLIGLYVPLLSERRDRLAIPSRLLLWLVAGTVVLVLARHFWATMTDGPAFADRLSALARTLGSRQELAARYSRFLSGPPTTVALVLGALCGTALAAIVELRRATTRTGAVASDALGVGSGDASAAGNEVAGGGGSSDRALAATVAPAFALLCVALGLLLPLGTEFVFIKDLFGSRMNSVFKLYYQAWVLLSIGGGFAFWAVLCAKGRLGRAVWLVPTALLLVASLAYPAGVVYSRTNRLAMNGLSLDGLGWWRDSYPDDLAAAEWLRANVTGAPVILEAYGGAYEHNGRISMATGLPAVLGWDGHEHQWRGSRSEIDPRREDIERMYKTADEGELRELLAKYNVKYVILGGIEQAEFGLGPQDRQRFERTLDEVFSSGSLAIYERP